MLDELLKGFIVNLSDLPWEWVKRPITSGRVYLMVKVYTSA
jgi:hypothetical protein